MSTLELKTEAIRLINEINADRMQDIVFSLRAFKEQQDMETEVDVNSPENLAKLNDSLHQAAVGHLISTEDVLNEGKRVLRDKMDFSRQR